MSASQPSYIAVVGGGAFDSESSNAAETVGHLIADAGAGLVGGGLGGVMEAACRGAVSNGGKTIGLLPGSDRSEANDHVQVAIPTGMGEMRNMLVVRAADAVIAISGEFGTLSEVAFALRIGKPVVGLGTWELSKGGRVSDAIEAVDSPEQAVDRALALARANL